ncbi:MAG TPA: endo-1,3-alpha-glucanase family glycosylhydrolase [Armatimonadota bacterium]
MREIPMLTLVSRFLLASLLMGFALTCSAQSAKTPKHPVFAHYMVCFAAYGENVEGYKREMREAQAAGIDGFALSEGAWHNEPHYVRRTQMLFQAATELGTDFKFIFSLDLATLKPVYIPEILKTYVTHPNYYQYQGRPLVSTFSGQDGIDWKDILGKLKADGINICFLPFFYPRPNITERPSYPAVKEHFAKWNDTVDGYFYFGAAGTDEQLAACNASYVKAAREDKKLVMSSYTPFYWGAVQPGRRYFETRGGFGVERQWKSIIDTQPDFVEINTWNDFHESYLCPVENLGKLQRFLARPNRPCHAGYLELSKYFIQWYKTGEQPKITKDGLFYVYRVYPKAALITPAKPVDGTTNVLDTGKPVTGLFGDVQDALYLTTMLTAPAELRVTSGGTESRHPMAKGYANIQVPFHVGAQHFALYRNGKEVLTLDGEPIQAAPDHYNFFPVTGFVYAK